MSISFDKAFGVQAAALKLRAQRHEVLAENLANADTPNFKARDLDFKSALQQVQGQSGGQLTMARTHAQHIGPGSAGGGGSELLYRVPFNPSLDGNTVESQVEQAKFAENSVHYQASLNFLGGRITSLIGAIRGE
ncbi:MAG: flagellar basal body rod protein FlgB [Ectothiorhodospiraceae bacterium]|nr:flagellar basal body rod protein FlgB [Ectothiorhodospiraceae bacterium]MCH8504604.1 flagellar basal body rod protein FlgB [Ectothiorhodospiraceae bacterium]